MLSFVFRASLVVVSTPMERSDESSTDRSIAVCTFISFSKPKDIDSLDQDRRFLLLERDGDHTATWL